MFEAHKDALRDRLVLDSRAANMLDLGQSIWCRSMASSEILSHIFLREHGVLLASGEDLKDYFYRFKVNHERTCRNVLDVKLTANEAGFILEGGSLRARPPSLLDSRHLQGGTSVQCNTLNLVMCPCASRIESMQRMR